MSDTARFSLIDECWIQVRYLDGTAGELSLREIFAQADRVKDLLGESPTQVFATLRLLLAILHRVLDGPENLDAWGDLYETGEFPIDEIESYLRRHASRFYLLHPETPFYQVAGLRSAKNEVSGLEKLIADVPTGGQLFTSRSGKALSKISFAEAARWLVQVQAYDVSGIKTGAVGDPRVKGGKGYPIGTGHAGALGGVYVVGDNLLDTLLLNLVSELAVGLPIWEREPHTSSPESHHEELRTSTGLSDLYTWQSRRIRLVTDDDGVTGVVVANGDKILAHETYSRETMTMWRRSKNQEKKLGRKPVYFPLTHDPGRSLWRSAEALLPRASSNNREDPDSFRAPTILSHLHKQRGLGYLSRDKHITVRAIGMQYGTQNAVALEVIDDVLSFNIAVMIENGDRFLRATVVDAVQSAVEACKATGMFASDLIRAAGGDNEAQVAHRDKVRETAYEAIDRIFREWIDQLDPETDKTKALTCWQKSVDKALNQIGHDLVQGCPPAAFIGRRAERTGKDATDVIVNVGNAQAWFYRRRRRALPLAHPAKQSADQGKVAA